MCPGAASEDWYCCRELLHNVYRRLCPIFTENPENLTKANLVLLSLIEEAMACGIVKPVPESLGHPVFVIEVVKGTEADRRSSTVLPKTACFIPDIKSTEARRWWVEIENKDFNAVRGKYIRLLVLDDQCPVRGHAFRNRFIVWWVDLALLRKVFPEISGKKAGSLEEIFPPEEIKRT